MLNILSAMYFTFYLFVSNFGRYSPFMDMQGTYKYVEYGTEPVPVLFPTRRTLRSYCTSPQPELHHRPVHQAARVWILCPPGMEAVEQELPRPLRSGDDFVGLSPTNRFAYCRVCTVLY